LTRSRRRLWWLLPIFLLIAAGSLVASRRIGTTRPFTHASGVAVRGSVAEFRPVILGGARQWLVIRGRSARDPILIWLHGGPGTEELGMLRHHNAVLEDHYLVVYWTQRGTGRSFDAAIPAASMTPERFVADLDELVGMLQRRFGQRKVVLVGHSWGSALGVLYAQAHPGKVAVYVGIGQVTNEAANETRSYAYTLAAARRAGDATAIGELTAIGPPPYSVAATGIERKWLDRFGGAFHRPVPFRELVWASVQASEAGWLDLVNYGPGSDFSMRTLWPQIVKLDLSTTARHFAMPVFIIAGRFDRNSDAGLAHDYFATLTAPQKAFVWFEGSAHSPPFEQPAAFNDYLIRTVLPVAKQQLDTEM